MKTVLITGASGGVGRAAARALEQGGWRVLAVVRTSRSPAPVGTSIELDLADEQSIAQAGEEVVHFVGSAGLQGLVNNAAISVDGPLELVPADALRRQFEVNVIGALALTQALLPALRDGGGRIVNVGGAVGRVPLPLYGALSASKAALDSTTATLRMELRRQGVKMSYIEPGALSTGFFDTAAAAASDQSHQATAAARDIYAAAIPAANAALAQAPKSPPEHVARAIARALSDPRPADRYVVGRDARLVVSVLRHLPTRIRDRLVLRSLGLGSDAFVVTAGGTAR